MATHYSANQYENAFAANRLQNYQVPNDFKEHPTARKGCTKIISNNRGHLLDNVPRSKQSPWGTFKGTWDDHLGLQKNPAKETPSKETSNRLKSPSPEQNEKSVVDEEVIQPTQHKEQIVE
eukprot:TCONS_00020641-protein